MKTFANKHQPINKQHNSHESLPCYLNSRKKFNLQKPANQTPQTKPSHTKQNTKYATPTQTNFNYDKTKNTPTNQTPQTPQTAQKLTKIPEKQS
jgi:hypothetical protein